jgi:hypothetical protein
LRLIFFEAYQISKNCPKHYFERTLGPTAHPLALLLSFKISLPAAILIEITF